MKILFCGTMLDEKFESKLSNLSLAGNRFQNTVINNMIEQGHEVIKLSFISIPVEEAYNNEILDSQEKDTYVFFDSQNKIKNIIQFRKCFKKIDTLNWISCWSSIYIDRFT